MKTARLWALEIAECRKPWIKSLYKIDKLESLGDAREILKFARAQAQKQAANLHHPLVCIDVIEEGIVSGPRAGLWKVKLISLLMQYRNGSINMHKLEPALTYSELFNSGSTLFPEVTCLRHLQEFGSCLLCNACYIKG